MTKQPTGAVQMTSKKSTKVQTPSWFIRLAHAEIDAQSKATEYGLPQTVYQTADTCGWTHTNPYSGVLRNAEIHATFLPANYFN